MIGAHIRSDDHVFEVNFDATAWASQADLSQLQDLRECGYRGDYPADEVGLFYEDKNREIGELFSYIRRKNKKSRKNIGFEVWVDGDELEDWIEKNRPEFKKG